jgi:hypothetical protein
MKMNFFKENSKEKTIFNLIKILKRQKNFVKDNIIHKLKLMIIEI